MLSKETSLDSNVAVSPENQLSSPWRCKPGKILQSTSEIKYANIHTGFFGAKILTNAKQKF